MISATDMLLACTWGRRQSWVLMWQGSNADPRTGWLLQTNRLCGHTSRERCSKPGYSNIASLWVRL